MKFNRILFLAIITLLQGWVMLIGQTATAVEKVTITVSDLDRAVEFYTGILEFEEIDQYTMEGHLTQQLFGLENPSSAMVVKLRLGSEMIELIEFSDIAGNSIPLDSRSNDLWFQHIAIVVSDMEKAYQRVFDAQVTHVSTAPQTLPAYIPAAAGITAFYFRDPDGHNLELIHYPKGKGNPRWQDAQDRLFLGIDHTAIGIDETERGLTFYEQLLHFSVAGRSENFGTEQEHLNQVFGARLLITGLQCPKGFGIEFLDYIAPPGGRKYPVESSPTDLWHWHTTVSVTGLDLLYEALKLQGYSIVSKGIVQVGNQRMLLARDPDGHAILLESGIPRDQQGG